METHEKIKVVKGIVETYVNENSETDLLSDFELNHVINIGTSILCTKWNIGYAGGGFVQAVVANDLSRAIGSADSTNIKALKLYCQMMYNTACPSSLLVHA
jgi:hypothetical protein|tara:strand:- start:297 stop:599 length:303 start_codon:yes stop_codon:yes gene_type:complete